METVFEFSRLAAIVKAKIISYGIFHKNFVEKIQLGSNSFFPYGTYFPSS